MDAAEVRRQMMIAKLNAKRAHVRQIIGVEAEAKLHAHASKKVREHQQKKAAEKAAAEKAAAEKAAAEKAAAEKAAATADAAEAADRANGSSGQANMTPEDHITPIQVIDTNTAPEVQKPGWKTRVASPIVFLIYLIPYIFSSKKKRQNMARPWISINLVKFVPMPIYFLFGQLIPYLFASTEKRKTMTRPQFGWKTIMPGYIQVPCEFLLVLIRYLVATEYQIVEHPLKSKSWATMTAWVKLVVWVFLAELPLLILIGAFLYMDYTIQNYEPVPLTLERCAAVPWCRLGEDGKPERIHDDVATDDGDFVRGNIYYAPEILRTMYYVYRQAQAQEDERLAELARQHEEPEPESEPEPEPNREHQHEHEDEHEHEHEPQHEPQPEPRHRQNARRASH